MVAGITYTVLNKIFGDPLPKTLLFSENTRTQPQKTKVFSHLSKALDGILRRFASVFDGGRQGNVICCQARKLDYDAPPLESADRRAAARVREWRNW